MLHLADRSVHDHPSAPHGPQLMGKPPATGLRLADANMPADQAIYRERTTGFEPATLTLARRRICSARTVALR